MWDEPSEPNLDFDLALRIFNDISNENHIIDWYGFTLMIDIYEIDNIKEFYDYICIIREVVTNFDSIFDEKTNNKQVQELKHFIETNRKKK